MHFDFKGIMEGAWNSIFVRAKIEEIANERGKICDVCPHNSVNVRKADPTKNFINPLAHCTLCGCNLHMKTRSLSQVCPDTPPRWEAVVTDKEEQDIDTKLNEEQTNLINAKNARNGR